MRRWELMVSGIVEIACGTALLLSFGFWNPGWDMEWCAWCVLRDCKRRIRERDGI